MQSSASRLLRVALAPVLASQPPGNLHTRREVAFEARNCQPRRTDTAVELRPRERPGSESARPEVLKHVIDERVALTARQCAWQVSHDLRVRVQAREAIAVRLAERA